MVWSWNPATWGLEIRKYSYLVLLYLERGAYIVARIYNEMHPMHIFNKIIRLSDEFFLSHFRSSLETLQEEFLIIHWIWYLMHGLVQICIPVVSEYPTIHRKAINISLRFLSSLMCKQAFSYSKMYQDSKHTNLFCGRWNLRIYIYIYWKAVPNYVPKNYVPQISL